MMNRVGIAGGKVVKNWRKRVGIFLLVAAIGGMASTGCSKEKEGNKQNEHSSKKQVETELEALNDTTETLGTEKQPEKTVEDETDKEKVSETLAEEVVFPISLDQGKLSVDSLFQTAGINPDSGNAEGTEIASIVLKNVSEEYLVKADVRMTLVDGSEMKYIVSDLPAGKAAMAFSVDNSSLASDAQCVEVVCDAIYRETPIEENKVLVDVDGIDIQVTNTGNETISKVVLYCHNSLEEEYFGGTSYVYAVSDLKSNESVAIQAVDCILGMAEVVLVEIE